jgi:hypothetical protein
MDLLEHVAAWQSMFAAIPNQGDAAAILLLLALGVSLLLRAKRGTAVPKIPISQSSFAYYRRYTPSMSPLQEAFSSGILHPKIF